jgi:5-methyltetrahydropteroyltriglutamate--homocysteine methyltransferase
MFREYGSGKELGLGVIDVHTDFIEPPELIRDRILYSVKVLKGASKIVVNPDCGLRTRSRDIAFSKLSNMIKGIKLAEEEVL